MNITAPKLHWVKSYAAGEFATVPGTDFQIHHGITGTYLVRTYSEFIGFADTDDEAISIARNLTELAEVCPICDCAGTGDLCHNHAMERL